MSCFGTERIKLVQEPANDQTTDPEERIGRLGAECCWPPIQSIQSKELSDVNECHPNVDSIIEYQKEPEVGINRKMVAVADWMLGCTG